MDRTYQGFKNYNYWNVYHWLTDDSINGQVMMAIHSLVDKDKATRYLLDTLPPKTPDGVRYTFRNIRSALKEL